MDITPERIKELTERAEQAEAEQDALAARLARVEAQLQDAWWAGRQSVHIIQTEKGTGPALRRLCAAQLASLPNREQK